MEDYAYGSGNHNKHDGMQLFHRTPFDRHKYGSRQRDNRPVKQLDHRHALPGGGFMAALMKHQHSGRHAEPRGGNELRGGGTQAGKGRVHQPVLPEGPAFALSLP